ncbi:MAG: hypothetical protein CFE24_06135 [Flavobacterium sp. BFFFF2]|nr:MAG: hypothetical protein CFE24_06135 [Flavobacterium sp. BFFFF2]
MIENINFRLLDIDKYVNEVTDTYWTLGQINELPFYESEFNQIHFKKYKRQTRRLAKGITTEPKQILTETEIKELKNIENKIKIYKTALSKVCILDCYNPQNIDTSKKYNSLFNKAELEKFNPNISGVYTQLKGIIPTLLEVSIEEIENEFKTSPLQKIDYYKNRLQKLKAANFMYLESILNGVIVDRLDDNSKCFEFSGELVKIKEIQYLENKIFELENPQIENNLGDYKKLSQKEIALLFYTLDAFGIFIKYKVSQDLTSQIKLICVICGLDYKSKIQDQRIYKYWRSVHSDHDIERVRTKENYENLIGRLKDTDFKEFIAFLNNHLKDLK